MAWQGFAAGNVAGANRRCALKRRSFRNAHGGGREEGEQERKVVEQLELSGSYERATLC